jgi:tripartite ATP-independent transporter DctP family solute receptor
MRGLLIAAALLLAGCRDAETARVLRLGHGLAVEHPVHRAMEVMAARLRELSGGRLELRIHPAEQLGSERECLELLQIGSLAMTKVSASVMENFAPALRVFGVPYLFRDDAHRFAVLDGPVGEELLRAGVPLRLRGLAWYDSGSRSFYTVDRAVRGPGDLEGLKIRTQESPTAMAMVQGFGAAATPLAWGELYTALQQGVVDGAENNPPSFFLSRHFEVARHYVLDEHTAVPDVLLVSESVWQQLSPTERGWLTRAADESAQVQRGLWREATDEALAAVAAAGVTVVHPDKAAFAAHLAPVRAALEADPGLGPWIGRIAGTAP